MPGNLMKYSQVALTIRGHKLRDCDTLSKSDPMAVIYKNNGGNWVEIGATECIKNNLNPVFTQKPMIPYSFEEVQDLRIEMVDYDGPGKYQLIGYVEVRLGELLAATRGWEGDLRHDKHSKNGRITIMTEELSRNQDLVTMNISTLEKLPKKDMFSSDPFLVFYRIMEGSSDLVPCHQTEVVSKNRSPTFKEIVIQAAQLCGGDYQTPIIVKAFDHDGNGKHDYMCEAEFSLEKLAASHTAMELEMQVYKECDKDRPDKATRHAPGATGKAGGKLKITFKIDRRYSFLDFVQGGTKLALDIAIDCTGSNGRVSEPSSLHYLGYGNNNQYLKNLTKIAGVLDQYDDDRKYAVYGFGAKVPALGGEVQHAFPLNFDLDNPEVDGLQGVIDCYTKGIQAVKLHGPTILGQILDLLENRVRSINNPRNYQVMLVFTDGIINDLDACMQKIIDLSYLPCSIIIIGLGEGDPNTGFAGMEVLDGDDGLLTYKGVKAARDIVQFVEARKYPGIDELCREVLKELPGQVEAFMRMKNLEPLPLPAPDAAPPPGYNEV